jgi:hypothetical protein
MTAAAHGFGELDGSKRPLRRAHELGRCASIIVNLPEAPCHWCSYASGNQRPNNGAALCSRSAG